MDKLDENLIKKIEQLLNIKFHEWQINYLLNIPTVLDMKIMKRGSGKTLVYIVKLLFSDSTPIKAYDIDAVVKHSDEYDRRSSLTIRDSHYARWFRAFLVDIYRSLSSGGIKTRPVFLEKLDEKLYLEQKYFEHMEAFKNVTGVVSQEDRKLQPRRFM